MTLAIDVFMYRKTLRKIHVVFEMNTWKGTEAPRGNRSSILQKDFCFYMSTFTMGFRGRR